MSSTRSEEREEEHDEEETTTCSCGLIGGFKRSNQVFDDSNSEILVEEDLLEEELFEININDLIIKKETLDTITEQEFEVDGSSTVFSLDFSTSTPKDDDQVVIYVAVGEGGDSSTEALKWALEHAVPVTTTTTTISFVLIHVFPQINRIPSPLGKIPRSHVNVEYVEHYLSEVKGKKKLLLQKHIDQCLLHSKVKVEMMLIEGDNVAQAIVELVDKLSIRKLVIGTTPSNLRKSGSRRRNSIADEVLKKAQESCDVRIICQGREVMIRCNSSSSRSKDSTGSSSSSHEPRASLPFMRFMSNHIWLFRPRLLSPR